MTNHKYEYHLNYYPKMIWEDSYQRYWKVLEYRAPIFGEYYIQLDSANVSVAGTGDYDSPRWIVEKSNITDNIDTVHVKKQEAEAVKEKVIETTATQFYDSNLKRYVVLPPFKIKIYPDRDANYSDFVYNSISNCVAPRKECSVPLMDHWQSCELIENPTDYYNYDYLCKYKIGETLTLFGDKYKIVDCRRVTSKDYEAGIVLGVNEFRKSDITGPYDEYRYMLQKIEDKITKYKNKLRAMSVADFLYEIRYEAELIDYETLKEVFKERCLPPTK